MYSNIGAKVKGLAVFVCVIGIVGSLIAAIVMWANDLVGAGFCTLIGGCLSAWIGSWVVYCIGDTNVKTTELTEQIMNLQNDVDRLKTKDNSAAIGKTGQKRMPNDRRQSGEQQPVSTEDSVAWMFEAREDKKTTPASETENGLVYALPARDNLEKCSKCGTIQKTGRSVCWNCGAKFVRNTEGN